jgi:predicted lysophospholipase L1 biosynthesis ABC-type transport system permease subunit
MARQFYGDVDPIGQKIGNLQTCFGPLGCIHIAAGITESEIVGVVRDVKYDGLRADVPPAVYISGRQSSVKRRTITVRTTGSTATLLPALRQEVSAMNPTVALTNVQTMDAVLAGAQSGERFSALLLSLFGVVALLLASVGVYGVLSYAVAQRRSEVGIRMALGADRRDVRGMVLNDGVKLILIGLGTGVVAAIALSGLLASQLYGVNPREPLIYVTVTTTLMVVGLVASYVPAWRATRVSPVIAMRAD